MGPLLHNIASRKEEGGLKAEIKMAVGTTYVKCVSGLRNISSKSVSGVIVVVLSSKWPDLV